MLEVKAVLFDLVGTSVREKDPAAIERCILQAFGDFNIKVPASLIRTHRGKDKREMISTLLLSLKAPLHLTPSVLDRFKKHFEDSLGNFETNEGFTDLLEFLRSGNILAGIGTGLSADLAETLFEHLRWRRDDFAYIGTASEAGRGRPHPDMINHMLAKLQLLPHQLLKVGDTIADIQEGKNGRAITAVLLAGTQDAALLIREKPDFILHSLRDLQDVLTTK
jgi:HAD superfamily hydrolase (TIGR01549 family)